MENTVLKQEKTGISKNVIDMQFQRIKNYPFHWHNSIEVLIVLDGSINVAVVDETLVLKKNGIEVLNINQVHRIWETDEENMVLILHIDANFAKLICPDLATIWLSHEFSPKMNADKNKLQMLLHETYEIVLQMIIEKKSALSDEDQTAFQYVKTLINTFDVMRNLYGDHPLRLERSKRVFDYLYNNINYINKITLSDISVRTEEYLNLDYLSALFKLCAGDSFQNIMKYFRAEYAIKQMLSTDKNIAEIALDCGYSAPRYFYKHFNEFFPEGPKEFRKRNKGISILGNPKCYEKISTEDAFKKLKGMLAEYPIKKIESSENYVSIYLFENETYSLSSNKKYTYLIDAKELTGKVAEDKMWNMLGCAEAGTMIIRNLFSTDMLLSNDGNTDSLSFNWESIIFVINLLEKAQLTPMFLIESEEKQIEKSLSLLKLLFQLYKQKYGIDAINGWRIEFRL